MKSILVDALRQAEGQPTAQDPDPELEVHGGSDDASTEVATTGSVDIEILEGDSPTTDIVLEIESQAETAASNDDGRPGDEDEPADSAHSPPSAHALQLTTRLLTPRATGDNGRPLLLGIARLSPILCLMFAVATAGGYLLLQTLVTDKLNTEISSVRDRARTNGLDDELPVGGQASSFEFQTATGQLSPKPEVPRTTAPAQTAIAPAAASRPAESTVSHASRNEVRDDAYALVSAGYAAYRDGQLEIAEREYRSALGISPNHAGALEGLAAVLMKTDRVGEAMRAYESLLAVEPTNTAAAAGLLSGSGTLTAIEAEREVKLLLQRQPKSAALFFALGTLYAKHSRWAEASQAFANASMVSPSNADYLFNLAVSLEHIGNPEEAKRYYRNALEVRDASSTVDRQQLVTRLSELESRTGRPQ